MTDESQLDRVENNILEREPIEMRNTPHTVYARWMESVDHGLHPPMLEVLGRHHDEDSPLSGRRRAPASCCQEGGAKAARSRLRRLGMGNDYDVSRFGPGKSIIVLTRTFQTVTNS